MPSTSSSPYLTSVARTATPTVTSQSAGDARGLQVFIDATASPNDAQTLIPAIQAWDVGSSKWQTITTFTGLLASTVTATATTETYVFTLYPGAAETSATGHHEVQALPVPATFRIVPTHSSSGSWTYTVSYSLLP